MRFVQFISLILILVSVQSARVCVNAFGEGGCKVAFSAEVQSLADGSKIKNLKVSPGVELCVESGETEVVMDWECVASDMQVVENGQPICADGAKRRSLSFWSSAARLALRYAKRHSHRIAGAAKWAANIWLGRRLLDDSCKQKESVACYAASEAYSAALNYDSAGTPDLPTLLCECPDYQGYLDTLECDKN